MKVTVFTPTYNRVRTLPRLYSSLKNQKCCDFEWLIVDDGSTDNTKELITSYQEEKVIDIRYFYQENGGKHRAVNKGIDIARGELFFIVDSDDYITDNAINFIVQTWDSIDSKHLFCGISGLKGNVDKKIRGSVHTDYIIDCTVIDYRYHHKITGDKAEIFITKLLRDNKYPEISGEKFIAESYVWNKIGSKYLIRWVNELIYIAEEDNDKLSLSQQITKLRAKNPRGTLLLYKENLKYDLPKIYKIKNSINYYRFLYHSNLPKKKYILKKHIIYSAVGVIGGYFYYLKDKIYGDIK